ncbi:hypothetical protein Cgig2_004464 [Carnegiea gigantea]|uniref:Uncharacterized protein n=1 Tax=Carnegiea gigantea TaxID=171969 RepID=A0A9Q1QGR1_9CARY|nr:hypothetical protein Cgig2_004464 [Carnegiea gigantea]
MVSLVREKRRDVKESKGTPLAGLWSKSKSKSATLPILMVGGNQLAQLVKMMKKIQTTLDESEKKKALMTTTLQTLIRDTPPKTPKTYKGNYYNRDKKDNGATNKEVHALDTAPNTPLLTPCILKHWNACSLKAPSLKTLSGQAWIFGSSATVTAKVGIRQVSGPSAARFEFLTSATVMAKVGRSQVSRPSVTRLRFPISATITAKFSGRGQVSGPIAINLGFVYHRPLSL